MSEPRSDADPSPRPAKARRVVPEGLEAAATPAILATAPPFPASSGEEVGITTLPAPAAAAGAAAAAAAMAQDDADTSEDDTETSNHDAPYRI